ncbi:MAG: DEAD/DEAH box helicase, partial [Candidatus Saccharimonadales bacterium]
SKFGGDRAAFQAALTFDYDGLITKRHETRPTFLDRARRRIVHRAPAAEEAALQKLFELGAKPPPYYERRECDAQIARTKFAPLVAALTEAGWHVEAEGNVIRRAGTFHISVSSGVDWFELDAQVDYGGVKAGLPELLAAAKRGDAFVTLGDGTQGMLPAEWLARYAPLAMLGTSDGEKLRFQHSQALLLDAWLAAQPEANVDEAFSRVREKLSSFEGVRERAEPAGFIGELRPYQREGLGWLAFLDDMGFGGCLADDMGLGKTIQVLARLAEQRRRPAGRVKQGEPSLVVVPRSLVQNWLRESARFTPELKVLDYTGLGRSEQRERFDRYDVVVTTYGTVRRDAGHLKDVIFDYAILDEAQAIKNSASQAAKACRLLQARRRLAMTGTPIENHLGELWS